MVKNAQHHVGTDKSWELVHYETSDEMVKFYDGKGNVLHSLNDLAKGGKILTDSDIYGQKYSGVYRVIKPKNAPSDFTDGKIGILSVSAIGAIGAPEFVHYTLIHQNGSIYNNMVVGSQPTGWTSGGQSMADTVEEINKAISLNQTNLKKLEADLDSLSSSSDEMGGDFSDFKNHNHDKRYVLKNGDSMAGSLKLATSQAYQFESGSGSPINLATYSAPTGLEVGNKDTTMKLISKGALLHNGKKVWSESNQGKGSGLDADLLQGVGQTGYALLSREVNSYSGEQRITSDKSFVMQGSGFNNGLVWRSANGSQTAAITHAGNGVLNFYSGDKLNMNVSSDGLITNYRGMDIIADGRTSGGILAFYGKDKTHGMSIRKGENDSHLMFSSFENGEMARFEENKTFAMAVAPKIQGRKLWMQGSTPGGSHAVGDIWIS